MNLHIWKGCNCSDSKSACLEMSWITSDNEEKKVKTCRKDWDEIKTSATIGDGDHIQMAQLIKNGETFITFMKTINIYLNNPFITIENRNQQLIELLIRVKLTLLLCKKTFLNF